MASTAIITGASRGLGLALARALAPRGWRLVIDARGADALEAARRELAAHTDVTALVGDVADERGDVGVRGQLAAGRLERVGA
ncbi:MAG TPA: SDR family NAD(P)-dependent oxidoreductase, partial [Solirubrobacteraceae bacterium]